MAESRRSPTGPLAFVVDTNVALDAVLQREPWDVDAVRLLDAVDAGRARGWQAAHAITTVYYVVSRARGRAAAERAVADLLHVLPVVPLSTADMQHALALGMTDYEDAVQAVAALAVGADFIVTRDVRDFRTSPVPARAPGEVLALL